MACVRCKGLVVEEYDVMHRCLLPRCLNCGWRGEAAVAPPVPIRAEPARQVVTPAESARKRELQRRRRADRYAEGRCRACSRARLDDGALCRICREKNRARALATYHAKEGT